jgi:hypothetical protein
LGGGNDAVAADHRFDDHGGDAAAAALMLDQVVEKVQVTLDFVCAAAEQGAIGIGFRGEDHPRIAERFLKPAPRIAADRSGTRGGAMPGFVAADDLVGEGILARCVGFPRPAAEQAVVLGHAGPFDGGLHGGGTALREVDLLARTAGAQACQAGSETGGGCGGEIVGDIDHPRHLLAHGRQNVRMVEAEIDALVGAAQVENPPAVAGDDPAALGAFNGNGRIVLLGRPALHQVSGLQPADAG